MEPSDGARLYTNYQTADPRLARGKLRPMDENKKEESQFPLLKDDRIEEPKQELSSETAKVEAPVRPIARVSFAARIAEREPEPILIPERTLKGRTRRDFLIYGAGAAAAAAGIWSVLPEETQQRPFSAAHRAQLDALEKRLDISPTRAAARKDRVLNKVLALDDDVAQALYSPTRLVPTYDKSRALSPETLRNNYDGQTPDSDYIADWHLTLDGLASGKVERLKIASLLHFPHYDQVTRLCCVEGWSAIAWWGGLRFADLLRAYPPRPGAQWAELYSDVNLDSDGNSDPYYVSIDLPTAQHPQALLATHQSGKPLNVDHGAPLRLIVPMKLGLKNIKAITKISYTVKRPGDYWFDRGYSYYDGL